MRTTATYTYQDEIQSAHWENTCTTIYTSIIYYSSGNEESSQNVKSEPYVVISNYLHAVIIFNRKIIQAFQAKHPLYTIKRIQYQSDGTAQHFKQKYTIFNMTQDTIPIDWHFSATSHGKGCIDGIGGTVKRRVREASNARKIDPRTSDEFAMAAKNICPNINILHVTTQSVEQEKEALDSTWQIGGKIINSMPGTRKSHCFISKSPGVVYHSQTSNSNDGVVFNFYTGKSSLSAFQEEGEIGQNLSISSQQDISNEEKHVVFQCGQWVEVQYDGNTFHGMIIGISEGQYRVKCLVTASTSGLYKFEPEENAV